MESAAYKRNLTFKIVVLECRIALAFPGWLYGIRRNIERREVILDILSLSICLRVFLCVVVKTL